MTTYLLLTLHVVICISLIIIVLLQSGKGADIGASFGAGASQTVFGAGGGKNFMTRLTTGVATIFMLTSLVLAYFWSEPTTIMPPTVSPTERVFPGEIQVPVEQEFDLPREETIMPPTVPAE